MPAAHAPAAATATAPPPQPGSRPRTRRLCGAMEPICGQAHGAGNVALLRGTLVRATLLLLAASAPVALLWTRVDAVLLRFGQQPDIAATARTYVLCLLPDLAVTAVLAPLKAYLSAQEVTLPPLLAAALALAVHIPLTVQLSARMGVRGVAAAVCLSDLALAITLAAYVLAHERRRRPTKQQPPPPPPTTPPPADIADPVPHAETTTFD